MKTQPNQPYVLAQEAGVQHLCVSLPGLPLMGRYSIKATGEQK